MLFRSKGLTDEMSTFIKKIDLISVSMQQASESIDEVVGQVANSAVEQAGQTDEVVMSLEENINALGKIVQVENSYKNNLEEVLKKINKSNSGVEKSSGNIGVTLENFNDVKVKSEDLEKRANDITKIVSIVAGIAEQTNLLALNASIEAARAGESGRGFTVVADEIRKLSEKTKESSVSINQLINNVLINSKNLVESTSIMKVELDKQWVGVEKSIKSFANISEYVATMTPKMGNLANSSNMIYKSSKIIMEQIQKLSLVNQQIFSSAEEIAVSSESTKEYSNHLAEYEIGRAHV